MSYSEPKVLAATETSESGVKRYQMVAPVPAQSGSSGSGVAKTVFKLSVYGESLDDRGIPTIVVSRLRPGWQGAPDKAERGEGEKTGG